MEVVGISIAESSLEYVPTLLLSNELHFQTCRYPEGAAEVSMEKHLLSSLNIYCSPSPSPSPYIDIKKRSHVDSPLRNLAPRWHITLISVPYLITAWKCDVFLENDARYYPSL